jgi:DNA-binding CsgD family transcriptional regulator
MMRTVGETADALQDDATILETAARVCTPKQLEALELAGQGLGTRRIARALGVTPQAVSARLDGAYRRLRGATPGL